MRWLRAPRFEAFTQGLLKGTTLGSLSVAGIVCVSAPASFAHGRDQVVQ